jgi:MULE transposase domain
MSQRNANYLQQCSTLFIDGTFKTCPHPFKQVITLHGLYKGWVLPFAFILLKGQHAALYRQMFRHLKRCVLQMTGGELTPRRIVSDFEIGLITSVEAAFPQARTFGCYFHFCQSIWRRVQQLGLCTAYKRDSHVKNFIRKVMALGYLPLASVRLNFGLVFASNTVRRLFRRYPALRQFIEFFQRNYINGPFQPPLWNVYNREMTARTNNHVEGKC